MKHFKIRNNQTRLYFNPSKRNKWNLNGKIYNTLGHARSAIKQIIANYHVPRTELEIVEFELTEKRIF